MHMHTEHSLVQLGRQITNYLVLPISEQAGKKNKSANRSKAERFTKCMPFLVFDKCHN